MKRTITARKVPRKDGINTPQFSPSATATLLPGAGLCVAPVIKSKFTPLIITQDGEDQQEIQKRQKCLHKIS